jgi:tripartite-type tricarboxylate transporter receptor subunit TctC
VRKLAVCGKRLHQIGFIPRRWLRGEPVPRHIGKAMRNPANKEAVMRSEMRLQRGRLWFGILCLLAATASIASSAQAESYPTGPVKFITQLAPGGGTDPAMRIVIDGLGKLWGQQTVLVNQPGTGGVRGARTPAAAAPDGYTLFMAIASTFTVLPLTQPNLPFNVSDFVPIGFVGEVPIAVAVSPTFPVNSLPELISYSKQQPGGLNVAVGLRGGITHLTADLFRSRSGADLTIVFYPGVAQAMSDVISGRVPVVIDGLAGQIAGGQLKLLAIASPARLPSKPDVPTVAETVLGFVASGWFVLVAPPGTPASIVSKVSQDLRTVLAQRDIKEKLDALSVSTRAMSAPELADFIRSEQALWKPVVQRVGLTSSQ